MLFVYFIFKYKIIHYKLMFVKLIKRCDLFWKIVETAVTYKINTKFKNSLVWY